jgi:ABC-2 type transport system ATP-binding protein
VINHGRVVLDDSVKTLKYSFAHRKIVDLKLEAPLRMDLEGVRILKTKEYSAKLEIDLSATTMEEVIRHIVGANRIVDITVSDPPMEEVIAQIYARRPGAASP